MLSIDSKNARALDDAVSIIPHEGRFKVGIHISDVAALFKMDSAIDKEALSRVQSVYILKRFHKPMLPRELN